MQMSLVYVCFVSVLQFFVTPVGLPRMLAVVITLKSTLAQPKHLGRCRTSCGVNRFFFDLTEDQVEAYSVSFDGARKSCHYLGHLL